MFIIDGTLRAFANVDKVAYSLNSFSLLHLIISSTATGTRNTNIIIIIGSHRRRGTITLATSRVDN